MMADLKGFKLSAKERLEKAANVPLPSPTIGVTGAFRAKSPAQAPTEAAPRVGDTPAAGQGKDQLPVSPEAENKEPAPKSAPPEKPVLTDAPDKNKVEGTGKQSEAVSPPAAMLMFRPILQFAKPMLSRAEAIANKLGVGVEMLVRKVASETTVEAKDFEGGDPAPRAGASYRGRIRFPKTPAERHLAKVDPLGLQDQGLVLRPVSLRAFDRAAEKILSDFERKTL